MSKERKKKYPPEIVQKVKELKKEGVKPKDIAAKIPQLEPEEVVAILSEKKIEVLAEEVVSEEEVPIEEKPIEVPPKEVVPEKKKVEEPLPNIFVVDHSIPTGGLTAGRVLVDLEENKCYPMNDAVNDWVRLNSVPIKAPSKNLQKKLKKMEGAGIPESLKLTYLREKLK